MFISHTPVNITQSAIYIGKYLNIRMSLTFYNMFVTHCTLPKIFNGYLL